MMTPKRLTALLAPVLATALLGLLTTAPATAGTPALNADLTVVAAIASRPDDVHLLPQRGYSAHNLTPCPLERIGDQFVRCDNLTGAGVPAPSYIPEAP